MGKKDQATKDAERNRKGEAASNRRLRWKTTGESDSVELQAEAMLADQRKRPGHVDSGGVNDAEAMAEQDRQTGVKNTEAGKALEAVRKKQIEAELGKIPTPSNALENGANAVMPIPPLRTPDNSPADTSLAPKKPAPAAPGTPAAPAVGAWIASPTTDDNGLVSAPSEPVGQGAPVPATTPPVAQGGAVSGKPAVPDWRQKRDNALKTNKFGNDITSWATSEDKEGKPTRDQLNKYGETLGISSDQIETQVEKARNQAATNEADESPLPAGKGVGGGDYRTDKQFAEDMKSGRNGERSVVTAKDKAWMASLGSSADKPKDAVSLYEGAYNRYQKGVGSENGAYNKADFEEMQKIREGASPAELRVINRISSGKGSTLSATETQHTEGNYKGSNQKALETYQSLLDSPQSTESDPDGQKRLNSINRLYGQMNSLDQSKVVGMTMKQSNDLLKSQKAQGLVDENGKATPKLLEIEKNTPKTTAPSSTESSVSKVSSPPPKKEDAVKPPVPTESAKSAYPEIDARKALEESNSLRSANLGGQVADGIEQETIRNNAIRQTEEDAIQNAHEMSVIGSVETPTDYYQAESESASKPSPTKEVVQKNNQVVADDFSAYEGQSPLGMAVAEVIPTILKTPLLMGEKVLETLVPDYNTKGDPEAAKIAQSAYAQERVTDLRARAEKIDTSSVFGKTKKANLLKAAREFESTIIKPKSNTQTSIDNKLQQRAAAYQAPINDVLERSNFLQRYA